MHTVFHKKLGIDYDDTYSPVVDAITLRFLIDLIVYENLDIHLMEVLTANLYQSFDNDIYMKVLKRFKIPETHKSSF